jgi:hypothetical protein
MITIASCDATSSAIRICSSGKSLPFAPPKLSAPMSSPPLTIGTTMYSSTPEASSASTSGPAGSARVSTFCGTPPRRPSISPMRRIE